MRIVTTLGLAAAFVTLPTAASAAELPGGGKIEKVDFERHVMGLLSKVGCNSGSCHGSFQGKNGFRLSLFGFEPGFDHAAITRDNLGRRVDLRTPDNSLLLLKATGNVAHEGSVRFGKSSWVYGVFRDWIAAGATHTPGSGAIKDLSVNPPDFAVLKNGEPFRVKVTATFTDGTAEDITPFCDFRVTDDAVASVSPLGVLTPRQPGDIGLTVMYRGSVRALRVLVPAPSKAGVTYPEIASQNFIDREVFAKLKLMNMVPSEVTSDLEFLRRVTIDTIGILPTPEEARKFLDDKSSDKREKKVEELLAHPLHSAIWATKLSDITGNNTDALENPQGLRPRRSQQWHDWLRKRVAENRPYDEIVRDILTASSTDGMKPEDWLAFSIKMDAEVEKGWETTYPQKKTLDLFWRRQANVPVEQWGEKVAAAFLGVRLECAQCHKHPTDRWTQDDYWGFANVFAPVVSQAGQFSHPDLKKLADEENKRRKDMPATKQNPQQMVVREVFFATTAEAGKGSRPVALKPIPMTTKVVPSKALGGPDLPHVTGKDTRETLWTWMRDPKNPFFARSFANRVWAHYLGVGLVNPVDDFSQANPPTNPRLLDALAKEFIDSGYDLRKLERAILLSRTYQLSARPTESNKFDTNNYARGYVRPLMAEQVVDVLNSALGVEENLANDGPAGKRMSEVGSSRLQNPNLSYVTRIFGRPPRTTACDCERAMEPALPQTLFLMSDPNLAAKLRSNGNRPSTIAKAKLSDEAAVEELFLATLTRLPSAKEKAAALEFLKDGKTRAEALQDMVWALINTREFILNH